MQEDSPSETEAKANEIPLLNARPRPMSGNGRLDESANA